MVNSHTKNQPNIWSCYKKLCIMVCCGMTELRCGAIKINFLLNKMVSAFNIKLFLFEKGVYYQLTVFRSSILVITPIAISLRSAGVSGQGYSVALKPSQIFFTLDFNWSPWKNMMNTDLYTWSPYKIHKILFFILMFNYIIWCV